VLGGRESRCGERRRGFVLGPAGAAVRVIVHICLCANVRGARPPLGVANAHREHGTADGRRVGSMCGRALSSLEHLW